MTSGTNRLRYHRALDLVVAIIGLAMSAPVLALAWLAAGRAAEGTGVFRQVRIGREAVPFEIVKFRTMRADSSGSTVTTATDARITGVGKLLRRTKIDEIPQLVNVLKGEMSLIGPRPDVAGFADKLTGEDRAILEVRPGITGPASVLFANEEEILATVDDADSFNSEILFPLKTAINRAWIQHGSILDDFRILLWTVKRPGTGELEELIHRWEPNLILDPLDQRQPT